MRARTYTLWQAWVHTILARRSTAPHHRLPQPQPQARPHPPGPQVTALETTCGISLVSEVQLKDTNRRMHISRMDPAGAHKSARAITIGDAHGVDVGAASMQHHAQTAHTHCGSSPEISNRRSKICQIGHATQQSATVKCTPPSSVPLGQRIADSLSAFARPRPAPPQASYSEEYTRRLYCSRPRRSPLSIRQ